MTIQGQVSIKPDPLLEKLLKTAPELLAHNMHIQLRKTLARFRREWLAQARTRIKFKGSLGDRGGDESGKRGLASTFRWVTFSSLGGTNPVDRLRGEFYTTSKAALGLEEGGIHRGKRGRLVLPLQGAKTASGRRKAAYRNPTKVMGRLARTKRLVIRKGDGPGVLVVYEKSTAKGYAKSGRDLTPIFLLVPQTRTPKLLKLMESWDRRLDVRQQELADGITATLEGRKLA